MWYCLPETEDIEGVSIVVIMWVDGTQQTSSESGHLYIRLG